MVGFIDLRMWPSRQKWNSDERLDDFFSSKLQGPAGYFVYGQFTHETMSNYRTLCNEFFNRFRVVETSKTFWVQLSHRNKTKTTTTGEL